MIRKKNKEIKLAEITGKYIGCDYTPYGKTVEEGFDCLSLMFKFMDEYKIEHSGSIKGWNLTNYYDLWNEDRDKAIEIWTEYLQKYSKEIDIKDIKPGDFILLKNNKTNELFYSIFAGNDKIIAVHPQGGVIIISLRKFKILRVFQGVK